MVEKWVSTQPRAAPVAGLSLGFRFAVHGFSSGAGESLDIKKGTQMAADIIVTTGDLDKDYDIIGPVYFQVSNKGLFSSALSKLVKQYEAEITQMKQQGQMGQPSADWGFLYGEWSVGQSDFEKAFFVAVQELKKRASKIGANAVIGMRQDIDLDTNAFQFFYLQMYGTAVKTR
jgi:hypothetical protein